MKTVKGVKLQWFVLVMILIFMCGIAMAQDNASESLVKTFDQYRVNNLQEKLFAHTDRSAYAAGEIIWFKLYVVDGHFNRPIDLSKVAYVEVLSRDLKPILQAKIALKGGDGNGSFLIPFSIKSGNYVFRAYTNWMKNFSPEFYFEKQISIVNSLQKPDWIQASNTLSYDIQFFPEGGNLVSGFQSKVAFRVVDQLGRGRECQGVVLNQNKDTVARFQPTKFGLGQFLFTPATGQTYTARVKVGNGDFETYPLPPIHEKGYVLNLTEPDKDHLLITVSSNAAGEEGSVCLFVHTRQLVRTAEEKSIRNEKATFLVDKASLEDGISHFTVFNQARRPVCERLYFKRPKKQLLVEVKPDKEIYALREKVNLTLSALEGNQSAAANLSIAVFLIDSLQSADQADIQSWLWLSADLKGRIESPDYYIHNTGAEADLATENLMLTHGWSRFRWDDVLLNRKTAFEFIPEYDGHIINGRITDRRTGLPVANTTTYLSVPGQKFSLNIATSNQKGELRFDVKHFYGTAEIVAQTNTRTDSLFRLDILNPYSEKYSANPIPPFELSEKWTGQLLFRSTHAQVENNFQTDKKQQFLVPAPMDSFAFYGRPDKKYFLDDYTRFITMEEVMREYVQEVRVRKQRDHFHFAVSDASHGYFFENDPMVLLDGIPIFDIDKIIAFDPLKIKKMEVITRRYFLDSVVNQGIVSYTTYQGNLAGFQLDANAMILEYPGLQYQREFFSPVYETSAQAGSRIPDFRNLLYWSPTLRSDGVGKKDIPFYTSDIPGNYAIVVQGLSANGFAGSAVSYFTVRKP